jgi:Domain of unknown function (4846)
MIMKKLDCRIRKVKLRFSFLIISLLSMFPLFAQESSIASRIPAPDGYVRKSFPKGSFSSWVQSLSLKNTNQILFYDGTALRNEHFNIFAVVNMPMLFRSDLEQCADYCMRFWAEYHKSMNTLDKLYLFDYNGNRKMFSSSGKSYNAFLKWSFSYANSHSLQKGCAEVREGDAVPGDMFVQNDNGGVGHASMIVDMAESPEGKKLYLIGFSFMPAQEFHIEKAMDKYGTGGWFTVEGFSNFLDDYLPVGKPVLRRFKAL